MEPLVNDAAAAEFLGITPRQAKELARQSKIPAHPLPSCGEGKRNIWRFRISELEDFLKSRKHR